MPMQLMQPMAAVGVAPVTAPVNPVVMQQPVAQGMVFQNPGVPTTVHTAGPPLVLQAPVQTGNIPPVAAIPAQPPVHVDPAMGIGLTPNETMAQNIRIAHDNGCYEPQDFMPSDIDPHRLYWVRELNGHWAVFPRRVIDRLDVRWYRTDQGIFYAVRLSE